MSFSGVAECTCIGVLFAMDFLKNEYSTKFLGGPVVSGSVVQGSRIESGTPDLLCPGPNQTWVSRSGILLSAFFPEFKDLGFGGYGCICNALRACQELKQQS